MEVEQYKTKNRHARREINKKKFDQECTSKVLCDSTLAKLNAESLKMDLLHAKKIIK